MEVKAKYTINELTSRLFPIYFYRKHLDLAARDLLGLDLAPHHRLILRDWGRGKQINLLFASRGMGKSVLIAIFYLLMAMLYPRLKMLMVGGGGFRQAKFVLLEVEKIVNCQLSGQRLMYYARNSISDKKRVVTKDPSFWSISFDNGSIIYAVPLGVSNEGSVIRGLRAHILGQDEAFLIPSKLYQAVLDPMSNVLYDPTKGADEQAVKNMSLMASTCDFSFRDFHKQYVYYKAVLENKDVEDEKQINKDSISLFEFNIDDAYYMKDGKKKMVWGLDYDKIIKKKLLPSTDLELWNAENKNIAMDISGGYFPFHSLETCMNVVLDEKNESFPEVLDSCSAPCILGIDTAPAAANCAFTIVKVGMYDTERDVDMCRTANLGSECPLLHSNSACLYKNYNAVIYAYEENKMSQKDRVKLIYDLMDRYNIISVAIDARGGGYELADLLRDKEYVQSVVSPLAKPIFDPAEQISTPDGLPILKLYKTTQDDNMIMAAYLKGLITNYKLLLPHLLHVQHDNPRILEAYGHCETLINQLARIKGVPAGKGLRFEIDAVDPETGRPIPGKKDLFSSLLYAVGRLRELMELKELEDPEFYKKDVLPVGFLL